MILLLVVLWLLLPFSLMAWLWFSGRRAGRVIERFVEGYPEQQIMPPAKAKDPKPIGYKPKQGYVFNPLLGLPRNEPCPCGSGKKFKRCHLIGMPRALDPHSIPLPKDPA